MNATGGGYEPGWVASDDSNITPTNANLDCPNATVATWTASASTHENLPITCANWPEAYAFCIWDGGFLPSESEWEYAAAGGSQQREYPWGSTEPGTNNQYAIYNCLYPMGTAYVGGAGDCMGVTNVAPVGAASQGAGRWGQVNLAGNGWEWNLDWYASQYMVPCTDCGYLTAATQRVIRGGSFDGSSANLLPPARYGYTPMSGYYIITFRCARVP